MSSVNAIFRLHIDIFSPSQNINADSKAGCFVLFSEFMHFYVIHLPPQPKLK